ncbi:MAG: class I SAM-dependent methyltransferase [Armatimonadetes bacterium]|nr:class I SAM-dependent methyltransferase [Armatimonadota bacterium]
MFNGNQDNGLSGIQYWQDRARQFGRRSILHIGHDESEIEAVTERQRDEIFPHLKKLLRGDERLILDFGCGTGRFTGDLAALIDGKAIGVDPVQPLIEMAPESANVEYIVMHDTRIPLADASADVIWICLVLGAIEEAGIGDTILEINRTLAPGGLLFLVENTSRKRDVHYWKYRTVKQHSKMFAFAPLKHLHEYSDLGERISVMAGRKQQTS